MFIKGNIVDLINAEIYPGELEIRDGKIAKISRINEILDNYILPGFIDAHVHIESSMLVPSEFAAAAVRHGTVAVITDPHEIANVLGVEGLDYMIDNGNTVPFKFYFGAPSCVPATGFESSGANLGYLEVGELLRRKDIYFLSEMMNFPGVINGDPEVLKKLELAREYGKPVDGHAPGMRGEDLKLYAGAGISTDHEAFTIEEGLEKIERGMKILIREGSAARNMNALAPLYNFHPEMLMLCSDDIHPEMLLNGHINRLVRDLVSRGYKLFDVLRSSSLNPAKHYNLDIGLLMEGDSADFIIVEDLIDFAIKETWIDGSVVFANNELRFVTPMAGLPNKFVCTELNPDDLRIKNCDASVKVIEVKDGELYTGTSILKWTDSEYLHTDREHDILKLVVKERYKDLEASMAFIRGFGIKEGAIASSVAHDSHNIIALGVDDDSICKAINAVIREKGGLAICSGSQIDVLPLPVAGIMSNVPCGTIAEKYLELTDKVKSMGSHLKAPFMTLSFMALLVIPELKLGDRGLFDGLQFKFTNLFEKY